MKAKDVHTGQRVLLGDADSAVRDELQEFLSDLGYRVDVVSSVDDLVSRGTNRDYDVILFDANVADTSMDVTLRQLTARPRLPGVVVMTNNARLQTVLMSFRNGAADFVVKPFDIGDLEGIVRRAAAAGRLASAVMETNRHGIKAQTTGDVSLAMTAGRAAVVAGEAVARTRA